MSSERIIGVIGCGVMGAGITQAAASAGFVVKTMDLEPEVVDGAHGKIAERLDGRVAKGAMSREDRDATVSRLRVVKDYGALGEAECVIEAVPEDMALKREVFGELDGVVSSRTLLATNTSSLSISALAEGLEHSGRLLGMHFFNPAPVMKLVELVQGPATDEQAMVDGRAICAKLSKTALRVKDSPGFIGNRVNRPFYLEALRLVESGEADIASVDRAVRDIGGFGKGPFELMDMIGIDVNLLVTEALHRDFGGPQRFAPSEIQRSLAARGHLGQKTGRGFYDYSDGRGTPAGAEAHPTAGAETGPTAAYETTLQDTSGWRPAAALGELAKLLERPADRELWIYWRILAAVVNEAALVADSIARPRDVNLAMELGFGYAEGPLAAADRLGLDLMQRLLGEFYQETGHDDRFKPNPLLDRHVAQGNLGEQSAKGFLYHAL